MLGLTKQERLVIYLLVILCVSGGIIKLAKEHISSGKDAQLEQRIIEFRKRAQKIDSLLVATPEKREKSKSGKTIKLININEAGIEELKTLPGIGEKTAKNIIEYRTEIGKFTTVEELLNVKGIGEKTLEKIRGVITIE